MYCDLQAMKAEMEKQEREHQESFAEVTVKHSKQLKDLGKKLTQNPGTVYPVLYQITQSRINC